MKAVSVGDVMSDRLLIVQENDEVLETIKRMRHLVVLTAASVTKPKNQAPV